jgi:dTDP-4-amino-4,6-dideoxygalactose transaminase
MGARFGGARGDCPVTEALGDTLVRLPIYNAMTPAETAHVIDAARSFRARR